MRQRLLVEIDRESEPISGIVRRLDGSRGPGEEVPARPFCGYMELIAALDDSEPEGSNEPGNRGGEADRDTQ